MLTKEDNVLEQRFDRSDKIGYQFSWLNDSPHIIEQQ